MVGDPSTVRNKPLAILVYGKQMTRLPILHSVLAATLLVATTAAAEETPTGAAELAVSDAQAAKAEAFIRTKHNKVRAVLRKPDTPKRAEELTALLGEFLDYQRLSELSLDTEWN